MLQDNRYIAELKPLADQLMQIAEHLRDGDFQTHPATTKAHERHQPSDAPLTRKHYAEIARRIYETRRRRALVFGNAELFGEPAWDILLDLYIALANGKDVSVSSACIGSAAPPTTGLRWLGVLAEQGLIAREQDADDQRRVLVRLTDRGVETMDEFFAQISRS